MGVIESYFYECSDCCVRRYNKFKDYEQIREFEVRIIKLEKFLENEIIKKALVCC